MKRLTVVVALLLSLSACSSTMPGSSPTSSVKQLLVSLFTSVTLTDVQIVGISGVGEPVLQGIAEGNPILTGALALGVGSTVINKAGFVLPITPEKQSVVRFVYCPPKLVAQCSDIAVNVPVTVYGTPIPGTELLLAKRISS